ncbi:MAG: hydroxymethylglutaryl-CoA lyase [Proteobacteria bacterium]|nr:hydroxymethylglutaryl-CoA lyase [Pseudomonadota bacterium]
MSGMIHIVDVSARDGLQNEKNAAQLSADDKVRFITMLMDAGLTRIEAGSFVKPSAVPAMANTFEVAEKLKAVQLRHPQVVFSYLVPNLKGLERAKEAQAAEVAIFLALSEQFSKANINQSVDESFAAIAPVITQARHAGMRVRGYISNIFGYVDLPFSPDQAARRSQQLLDMGCYEVSLGDTTALATPEMVAQLMHALEATHVPLARVAMHFHDTFGRAIDNVAASYAAGIRTFDAAAGGLGGCPYANSPKGNLKLEDLVAWCNKQDIRCDVRDADALARASAFMLAKLGK